MRTVVTRFMIAVLAFVPAVVRAADRKPTPSASAKVIVAKGNATPAAKSVDPKITATNKALDAERKKQAAAAFAKREAVLQDRLKNNPASEGLHTEYVWLLIEDKQYAKAKGALDKLRKLNPASMRARTLSEYLTARQGAKSEQEERAIERDKRQAVVDAGVMDSLAAVGITGPTAEKISAIAPGARSEAITAEITNAAAARAGEFSASCDMSVESELDRKAAAEINQIRKRKGEEGMAQAYSSLEKKFGATPIFYILYSEMYRGWPNGEAMAKVVAAGEKRHPGNLYLKLLREQGGDMAAAKSDEARGGLGRRIGAVTAVYRDAQKKVCDAQRAKNK